MTPSPDALPARSHFDQLARAHTLVPVYRTLTADLETPVSAFLRLAHQEPEAFLFESVEGGERVGRYTFMGIEPYRRLLARGTSITASATGTPPRTFEGDLFAELRLALAGHTPARLPGLPPFTAGAVGFFAYDVVRLLERLPALAADELGAPDACLMFFDQVLAFDHVKKEIHLIVTADLTRQHPAEAYDLALHRLAALEARLAQPLPKPPAPTPRGPLELTPRTSRPAFLDAVSRTKEYIASGDVFQCVLSQRFDCTPAVDAFAIYRALRIVNPSPYMYFLRFPLTKPPGAPHLASEMWDPQTTPKPPGAPHLASEMWDPETTPKPPGAPHLASEMWDPQTTGHIVGSSPELLVRPGAPHLASEMWDPQTTGHIVGSSPELLVRPGAPHLASEMWDPQTTGHIVGSSPELLVRVHGRKVEYRPIAGTRPRGEDEAADRALEADLRADEKEVAEHIMLVDLGRNDVGRVSVFGSVKVKDLMFVERYSHVMHLVSSLEGTLKPELSALDAFKACFPAGTLSGAPKIRAMEIIEEMEPARRGVYGGSILYADFSGNLDSCIAIRTLFMDGDRGHIQAGAGIVADSIAENEFAECANKAQAVVRAIERARQS